jgi:hypothetical protein
MMSLTLPKRCLWGNLPGRCEAPWDPLRPPVFFSPCSSVHETWFGPSAREGMRPHPGRSQPATQARRRVRRRASQRPGEGVARYSASAPSLTAGPGA